MSHEFDSGFMVNTPSWHKLENAVLKESPKSWEDARQQAGLTWEVEVNPVLVKHDTIDGVGYSVRNANGWQALSRDDTDDVLSIQPTTYQVIHNHEFGEVIDTLMGIGEDEHLQFEALMSLYGGRQIIALARFEDPLEMPWDDSRTFSYVSFASRHDGQGGLRVLPTNVRIVCANTQSMAEHMDGAYGVTIRHSSNWEDRVKELSYDLTVARKSSQAWAKEMETLARWTYDEQDRIRFLQKLLPVSDDMTERVADNRKESREQIDTLLRGTATTEHIKDTGYGLLMAVTEWDDHIRDARSLDSHVNRQLLTKSSYKVKASSILREMVGS